MFTVQKFSAHQSNKVQNAQLKYENCTITAVTVLTPVATVATIATGSSTAVIVGGDCRIWLRMRSILN